jgi:hypothetical protein
VKSETSSSHDTELEHEINKEEGKKEEE